MTSFLGASVQTAQTLPLPNPVGPWVSTGYELPSMAQAALGEAMINLSLPQMRNDTPQSARVAHNPGNLHILVVAQFEKVVNGTYFYEQWRYNDAARQGQPAGWVSAGNGDFSGDNTFAQLGDPWGGLYVAGYPPDGRAANQDYPSRLVARQTFYYFDYSPFVPDSHQVVFATLVSRFTLEASSNYSFSGSTIVLNRFGSPANYGVSPDNADGVGDVGQIDANSTNPQFNQPLGINPLGSTITSGQVTYVRGTMQVSYEYAYYSQAYSVSSYFLRAELFQRQGDIPAMVAVSAPVIYTSNVGQVYDSMALDDHSVAFLFSHENRGLDFVVVRYVNGVLSVDPPVVLLALSENTQGSSGESAYPLDAAHIVRLSSYPTMQMLAPGVLEIVLPTVEQDVTDPNYASADWLSRRTYTWNGTQLSAQGNLWVKFYTQSLNNYSGFTVLGSTLQPGSPLGRQWIVGVDNNGNFRMVSTAGAAYPVFHDTGWSGIAKIGHTASALTLAVFSYNTNSLRYATIGFDGVVTTGVTPVASSALGLEFEGGSDKPWANRGGLDGYSANHAQVPWGVAGYGYPGYNGRFLYFGTLDVITGELLVGLPPVPFLSNPQLPGTGSWRGNYDQPSWVVTPSGLGYAYVGYRRADNSGNDLAVMLVQFGSSGIKVAPYLRMLQRNDGDGINKHARLNGADTGAGSTSEQSKRAPRLTKNAGIYL